MEKVGILLVGIGGYGENYLKVMFPSPINDKCYLLGIVDPYIEKSKYYEELKNNSVPLFNDLEEAFNSGIPIDLAVISSPIHTHYEYINKCFDNKVNILCEKPVTVSIEKMNQLIQREEEGSNFCAVGYQLCFSKDILKIKEDILSGKFGKPKRFKALRMMRRGDKYYSRTNWAGKLKINGELILDSPVSNACAHQIQLMLFLLGKDMYSTGKVKSVSGRLDKARGDIENFDAAQIKIETEESVPLYYYTAHSLKEAKVGPLCHFEFEEGTLEGSDDNFSFYFKDGRVINYDMDKGDRMEKLIASIDSCLNNKHPYVSLKSSIEHIRVVLELSKIPVYLRPDSEKIEIDGDYFCIIPDLKEHYEMLYKNWLTE